MKVDCGSAGLKSKSLWQDIPELDRAGSWWSWRCSSRDGRWGASSEHIPAGYPYYRSSGPTLFEPVNEFGLVEGAQCTSLKICRMFVPRAASS